MKHKTPYGVYYDHTPATLVWSSNSNWMWRERAVVLWNLIGSTLSFVSFVRIGLHIRWAEKMGARSGTYRPPNRTRNYYNFLFGLNVWLFVFVIDVHTWVSQIDIATHRSMNIDGHLVSVRSPLSMSSSHFPIFFSFCFVRRDKMLMNFSVWLWNLHRMCLRVAAGRPMEL